MVHAACVNWGGLMAARFFLGVGGMNSFASCPINANFIDHNRSFNCPRIRPDYRNVLYKRRTASKTGSMVSR